MNLSSFEKAMGIKTPIKPGLSFTRPKPSAPKPRPIQQNDKLIEAAERQRKLWERYKELHNKRLARISNEYPQARRYLRTLANLERDAECIGYWDCDVDISGLAQDLNLAAIREPYDRFVLVEETVAWIWELAKKRKMKREEYEALCPLFGRPDNTSIDELKSYLALN